MIQRTQPQKTRPRTQRSGPRKSKSVDWKKIVKSPLKFFREAVQRQMTNYQIQGNSGFSGGVALAENGVQAEYMQLGIRDRVSKSKYQLRMAGGGVSVGLGILDFFLPIPVSLAQSTDQHWSSGSKILGNPFRADARSTSIYKYDYCIALNVGLTAGVVATAPANQYSLYHLVFYRSAADIHADLQAISRPITYSHVKRFVESQHDGFQLEDLVHILPIPTRWVGYGITHGFGDNVTEVLGVENALQGFRCRTVKVRRSQRKTQKAKPRQAKPGRRK